ncbi:hypothetical protein CRE_04434 [Caenorhabditis remanei]|uniref:Mos1 transposase HTH domain-containing protein n=1 Tax=Caenorhabditis remanei TaxID=31234 RepID=E3NQS2_CAERE|nr:hypothetical protein CRE_04434 [Caenorhabditis remanei]
MNAAPIFVPDRLHICHVILFLFLSNSKITEIEERMVEVYKDNAPQRQTISRWVRRFKNKDFSLAEEPRSGRPMELDIDKLREVVESGPFQFIRELTTVMGSTHSAVKRGLGALGKVKKIGRWIPHKLSDFDLERRVDMSLQLQTLHPNFNWLDHLVTSDEKWVLYENHHRRAQSVDADKQPKGVVKQELHPKKILLSFWWSVHGVLYWELLPEGKISPPTTILLNYRRKLKRVLVRRSIDVYRTLPYEQFPSEYSYDEFDHINHHTTSNFAEIVNIMQNQLRVASSWLLYIDTEGTYSQLRNGSRLALITIFDVDSRKFQQYIINKVCSHVSQYKKEQETNVEYL